jgi:hypothetical protein
MFLTRYEDRQVDHDPNFYLENIENVLDIQLYLDFSKKWFSRYNVIDTTIIKKFTLLIYCSQKDQK